MVSHTNRASVSPRGDSTKPGSRVSLTVPSGIPQEPHQGGPECQGNDEGSSESCGPQLPLHGVPATDPSLRMPASPCPGPRGGNSRIWPQRSALMNWKRSGPRCPSRPAGLATFLGAGGGGRRRDGTRAQRGRERLGQVGPGVTPPLPQGPQQVDSAQRAARGPQAHPEAGCCLSSRGLLAPRQKRLPSPQSTRARRLARVWSRIRRDGRL